MTFEKITNTIIDSYLNYVSNTYYDSNNNLKNGLNKYNEKLEKHDYLKLDTFTNGRYDKMLSSFLFASINNVNSTQGSYIGDSLGYTDTITMSVKIYKQVKPPHIFLAYSVIPIVLNQTTREWAAFVSDSDNSFTIYNISINIPEPILDINNDSQKSLNDFSSVKGVAVELNINFSFQSSKNYEEESEQKPASML